MKHTPSVISPTLIVPIVAAVVVIGGAVYAMVRARSGRKGLEAIDRWGHAAFALWTGGEDSATWALQRAQESLKNWYGATNATSLRGVIKNLRDGQTGNPAWDNVRALDLVRIGMAATYLDVEQGRTETAAIGRDLQKRYRSWEELGQAFEAGMQTWQRSRDITDPEETGRVQRNLPKLRQEIWPAVAYTTSLVIDD